MPVISATWEAEAGELFEPGLGGRDCSELRSYHCTPAWVTRAKLRLKKKERKKENWLGSVAHTCKPNTGEPRWEDYRRSGVQDQPGQYMETLSPSKQI